MTVAVDMGLVDRVMEMLGVLVSVKEPDAVGAVLKVRVTELLDVTSAVAVLEDGRVTELLGVPVDVSEEVEEGVTTSKLQLGVAVELLLVTEGVVVPDEDNGAGRGVTEEDGVIDGEAGATQPAAAMLATAAGESACA